MPVRPQSDDNQDVVDKSNQVFSLQDGGKFKNEFGWPRDIPRLFGDNLRWIIVLGVTVGMACIFFGVTKNDLEGFIKLVLALAVGGSISAAASFRVIKESRAKEKSEEV